MESGANTSEPKIAGGPLRPLTVKFPNEQVLELRVEAAKRDQTMGEFVREAVTEKLEAVNGEAAGK